MTSKSQFRRPMLAGHARYRWDQLRQQHQIVFPEGMLVLNETAAAIVQLCDGRSTDQINAALREQFSHVDPTDDMETFLQRLAKKGILRDAADA